jgi:hypothetical protein
MRRTLTILTAFSLGTLLGGVGHANQQQQRSACEQMSDEMLVCDDGTVCYLIDGLWVCHPAHSRM